MEHKTAVSDPFALMMNPEAVLAAVERSERLQRLQRHVCRPLDKPVIPCPGTEEAMTEAGELIDTAFADTLL